MLSTVETGRGPALSADAPHPAADSIAQDLSGLGIGLVASHRDVARSAEALLRERYRFAEEADAATLVALGGDGYMLHVLHAMLEWGRAHPAKP